MTQQQRQRRTGRVAATPAPEKPAEGDTPPERAGEAYILPGALRDALVQHLLNQPLGTALPMFNALTQLQPYTG